jgi:hypothetical protein
MSNNRLPHHGEVFVETLVRLPLILTGGAFPVPCASNGAPRAKDLPILARLVAQRLALADTPAP